MPFATCQRTPLSCVASSPAVSLEPGRDAGRADDVRTHRRHAGIEPERRTRARTVEGEWPSNLAIDRAD